jgi:hypothetical protein
MTAKWNIHRTRPRSVMDWPLFQVRRKNLAWEQTMFEDLRRERMIRKALRAIARQRVTLILQPGNVMVLKNGTPDAEWFNVAIQTSHKRGWVDILHDSIPSGTVQFEEKTRSSLRKWIQKPCIDLLKAVGRLLTVPTVG